MIKYSVHSLLFLGSSFCTLISMEPTLDQDIDHIFHIAARPNAKDCEQVYAAQALPFTNKALKQLHDLIEKIKPTFSSPFASNSSWYNNQKNKLERDNFILYTNKIRNHWGYKTVEQVTKKHEAKYKNKENELKNTRDVLENVRKELQLQIAQNNNLSQQLSAKNIEISKLTYYETLTLSQANTIKQLTDEKETQTKTIDQLRSEKNILITQSETIKKELENKNKEWVHLSKRYKTNAVKSFVIGVGLTIPICLGVSYLVLYS